MWSYNPDDKNFDLSKAVTLTGKARSMTIHHARTLHGSAPNNSNRDRMVLFYECNSADAWPLVGVGAYLKNSNPIELCNQLERQMVCGEVSYQPVMENVPVVFLSTRSRLWFYFYHTKNRRSEVSILDFIIWGLSI